MDIIDIIEIKPYTSIGKIKLGMSSQEVNNIMKNNYKDIHINNGKEILLPPTFNIGYDKNDKAIFIELCRSYVPRDDICPAIFKGVNVFTTKAKELISYIEKFYEYDKNDWELGCSYIFKDIDLALWRSSIFKEEYLLESWFQKLGQEEKEQELSYRYFETVIIGIKGYFDREPYKSSDDMSPNSNVEDDAKVADSKNITIDANKSIEIRDSELYKKKVLKIRKKFGL